MANGEKNEENIPSTGAIFTFGRSRFADNEPNKFWIRDDPVKHVACGDEHTLLLTATGRVFTFGSNDYGQLGQGHTKASGKPTCIKDLKGLEASVIACGRSHSLVSVASGVTYAFGQNNEGQLGVGDDEIRTSPTIINKLNRIRVVGLDGGAEHSIALTGKGQLLAWGSNSDGQLGVDDSGAINQPNLIDFEDKIKQAACGYYHTAFVTEKGELYTFGEGDSGKLGFPASRNVFKPKLVASIRGRAKKVSCGGRHTAVVTEIGSVYVFGDGSHGQLGLGSDVLEADQPELIDKISRLKARDVVCGENHTAVIAENNQLYLWGDGQHGKLAVERNVSNLFVPQQISRFLKFDVFEVSCGGCHTIVLAKPSNLHRSSNSADNKKLVPLHKSVSFHNRHAKSEDDDSDKSENERRRSFAFDRRLVDGRDGRRLKSLHDSAQSLSYNSRSSPPTLSNRNGLVPISLGKSQTFSSAYNTRDKKADTDSDSDKSPAAKTTSLYSKFTFDKKTESPFAAKSKSAAHHSDSDASPPRYKHEDNKTKSNYLYKNHQEDSSDEERHSSDKPPKYGKTNSNSSRTNKTNGGRSLNNKGKKTTTEDSDDSDDSDNVNNKNKRNLDKFAKMNLKNRKTSDSNRSSDEDEDGKRRNNSASTTSSVASRNGKDAGGKKSKFMEKFRNSKKASISNQRGSISESASKDAIKSKTCTIL